MHEADDGVFSGTVVGIRKSGNAGIAERTAPRVGSPGGGAEWIRALWGSEGCEGRRTLHDHLSFSLISSHLPKGEKGKLTKAFGDGVNPAKWRQWSSWHRSDTEQAVDSSESRNDTVVGLFAAGEQGEWISDAIVRGAARVEHGKYCCVLD